MALNNREKSLLGGLALVGALLVGYTFVHEPLTARRAEARGKLEQVETELIQEQKKLTREGDLQERKAKVTAREQMVDAWVPGKNSAALLIWHLSQAEQLSGARIRAIQAGEKSVVTVAEKTAAAPNQAGSAGQAGGQGQAPAAAAAQSGSADGMASLVMIPLEMRVDGKFAEHLIFNQYIEEAPLFLATHGIVLTRQGQLPMEKVSRLVLGGNPWLAEQILSESPPVDGVYRFNLYFKADKPGPSTEEMQFDSQPGRIDPFVMDAVDEFIRWLQEYFAGQEPGDGTPPPSDPPQLG